MFVTLKQWFCDIETLKMDETTDLEILVDRLKPEWFDELYQQTAPI
jgi:hypothetical protein